MQTWDLRTSDYGAIDVQEAQRAAEEAIDHRNTPRRDAAPDSATIALQVRLLSVKRKILDIILDGCSMSFHLLSPSFFFVALALMIRNLSFIGQIDTLN